MYKPFGVDDFRYYEAKAAAMLDAELEAANADALQTARNMKDVSPVCEGRYMDEASIYRGELNRRKRAAQGRTDYQTNSPHVFGHAC